MDVDLDDAGVGRDADDVEARVVRRGVALDMDRQADLLRGGLGGGDELEIVLERLDRRHEDAEPAVARLDRERGAHRAADVAELLLDALLLRGVVGGEVRHRLGAGRVDRLRRLGRRRGGAVAEVGQRPARHGRVDDVGVGIGRGRHVGQRAERQAVADRAVAGDEEEVAAADLPLLGAPAAAGRPSPASAGPAGRSRTAWSGRARRPGPCGGAPRGPRAWSSPGSTLSGRLASLSIHSAGSS